MLPRTARHTQPHARRSRRWAKCAIDFEWIKANSDVARRRALMRLKLPVFIKFGELNTHVCRGRLLIFWKQGTAFGRCVNRMSQLVIVVIVVLLPGILATSIADKLTVHSAWDSFKFPLYALLLGVLTYSLLQLLVYGCYKRTGSMNTKWGTESPVMGPRRYWPPTSRRPIAAPPAPQPAPASSESNALSPNKNAGRKDGV